MKTSEPGKLSRRIFLKKSILAASAIGISSVIGYDMFNRKTHRSLRNMLRMGHCAPSIMQTLLEMNDMESKELIICAGGLAGGIAGERTECGGISAPLMFLSMQNDYRSPNTESLALVHKCQRYTKVFITDNGSYMCGDIRKKGIASCMKVICGFHGPFSKSLSCQSDFPSEMNIGSSWK